MIALEHLAAQVVALFGLALVHGTVLAAIAGLLAFTVLRRARPAVHAALWTVVLLKFLVPFGPGARFSLASLAAELRREPEPEVALTFAGPAEAPALAPRVAAPAHHHAALAAVSAWLLIAAALGARQLVRYRRARLRALAGAPAPTWLLDEIAGLAGKVGVRRAVTVRVAGDRAPYVIGLRRPVVVVPEALLADGARTRRQAALAHELAHVRRADGAVRALQLVASTVFFFWPAVHWVNRRLDLAREQACDAYAIAVGPLAPAEYARMLITVARTRTPAAALALGGSQLARRVEALVESRRRRALGAGVGPLGAAAVGAFALVGLTGAASAAPRKAAAPPRVCLFTPEVAASILASHPEADTDGDGALTRTEVCDFQLSIRRRAVAEVFVSGDGSPVALDASLRDQVAASLPMSALPAGVIDEASPLASDDLCCNCSDPSGPPAELNPAIATCTRGVEP